MIFIENEIESRTQEHEEEPWVFQDNSLNFDMKDKVLYDDGEDSDCPPGPPLYLS